MPIHANASAAATARGVKSSAQVQNKYTTAPADRLLERLERVRSSGRGWTARCPAHEDRTASLSISIGEGDAALVHCFAGCGSADVVAAVGLQLADLFVRKPSAN